MYRMWASSPCTMEIKQQIVLAMLSEMDQEPPLSFDQSIPFLHQREGFRKALSIVMDWEPESVIAARERGEEIDE